MIKTVVLANAITAAVQRSTIFDNYYRLLFTLCAISRNGAPNVSHLTLILKFGSIKSE